MNQPKNAEEKSLRRASPLTFILSSRLLQFKAMVEGLKITLKSMCQIYLGIPRYLR